MVEIIVKIVVFILWVNFLPPLADVVWGQRFNWPVDGGRLWIDGRPVFGPNKTFRGIFFSMLGGAAVFPLMGVAWWVAGVAALLAMLNSCASGVAVVNIDNGFGAGYMASLINRDSQLSEQ